MPHYMFMYAPTSFQWRDVLISDSPFATAEKTRATPGGIVKTSYAFTEDYTKNISFPNKVAAFFVSVWIYLFFLLILGFGYSYFWTASSLLYLLMRRHVDDTELDEIHMEEEEGPDAFMQDMGAAAAAPQAPAATGGGGFSMVDSPTLRTHTPSGDAPSGGDEPAPDTPAPPPGEAPKPPDPSPPS